MNRDSIRLLLGIAVAALSVAAIVVLMQPGPSPSSSGDFAVSVVGPTGGSIFNGTISGTNATALSVLLAAGVQGGFDVQIRGGLDCPGAYVVSVAGQGEGGRGGWTYRVAAAGAAWGLPPGESSACCNLRPGDRVEWRWSEEGTLGPACP